MSLTAEQLAAIAVGVLAADDRRRAVVYLDSTVVPGGSRVEIDGAVRTMHRDTAVAFVDDMPGANWGHPCRYLLMDVDTGDVEVVPAHLPPFIRGVPRTLRVVWHGDEVPDWAIASPEGP